jgi:hypothetical protein
VITLDDVVTSYDADHGRVIGPLLVKRSSGEEKPR